jgi:hypothetical protein
MTRAAGCDRHALALSAVTAVFAGAMGGCGGGGGSNPSAAPEGSSAGTVVYAHSLVLGVPQPQSVTYVPAVPPLQPVIQTANGGSLLGGGPAALTAEYIPPSAAGVRVSCVSGNGTSIGVLDSINPGVVSVSAAVLFDAGWNESDADSAWAMAAAASERWDGWENCGVKPEGMPFKSSTVTPAANGGYSEDVVVGNPASNFTTLRLDISSLFAADMRRTGALTSEDPLRPLRLTWRAFKDASGNTVWVERGEPAASAPVGTRGFIALFVPNRLR